MKRIQSTRNKHVREWKKLHTKKGRDQSGLFLIEGFHLIEEAIRANVVIETLLIEAKIKFDIPKAWFAYANESIVVTKQVIAELADTMSPQGCIAICKQKKTSAHTLVRGSYVLLDRLQDPGNVGTIIRTADSAGMAGVIAGEGTVDVYNSKVIRSSQGSLFHLPIYDGNLLFWVEQLKEKHIPVFGTALEQAVVYTEVEVPDCFALIVGNEGEGLQDELLQVTDQNVYIPIYGKAESLNVAVAAGILLYAFRKKDEIEPFYK